jgi:TatD DNase family protein
MLYDAHNHLQDSELILHREGIFEALAAIQLAAAVVNGTREFDWDEVAGLAESKPWVIPSFGLHPWWVAGRSDRWLSTLIRWLDRAAAQGKWHGVGEIGLDRWKKPFDGADQEEVFLAQLALATERNLPVTIHCLEAWGALDALLQRHPVPARGFLLHAYGGPVDWVPKWVERGAYFSFNGYFLHERKEARREAFKQVPLERLLVETDAPAMPPPAEVTRFHLPAAPDGARLNHPANLAGVYAGLADMLGVDQPALVARVEANFRRFFGTHGNELPAGGLGWNR